MLRVFVAIFKFFQKMTLGGRSFDLDSTSWSGSQRPSSNVIFGGILQLIQ